ncbi:MAG TPA: 5'-nucleotidase C-terminal domain-containing protein [Longimicrobiales bacterium]|nr:5'-nucleotidase C-terminal domain-containing protein [Longimicrobiales bacterium]
MRIGSRTGLTTWIPGALLLLGGCAGAGSPVATLAPAADTMSVVLLGTTDVHGRLYPHDYYTGRGEERGLSLLKPLVDSVRAAHPGRTLLFDSGDILQGNPLGYLYARVRGHEPNPIIRAMNLMGYDAAAIGNHEFNYGLDHLRRAIDQADFPFVSANVYRHGTGEHAYAPFTLIPLATPSGDTVIVGVTGNTPPGVHVWDRDHVEGVLEFREVVGAVRSVVADMRAGGADIVVVLSHGGLEGTSYDTLTTGLPPENTAAELARQEPGIDVIFLGHTHREVADTTINGVLLTQARNWATSLAAATLTLRRGAGGWRVERKRGEILRPVAALADRAFMDSLRWEHERTLAYVTARIGEAPAALPAHDARVRDTPIIDFINEVQRRTAGTQLSATAAFQLNVDVPAGDITVAQIAALYPYDNTLRAIRITGAQLRAYLEKSAGYYAGWPAREGGTVTNFAVPGYNFDIVSGVDYVLDISRPAGSRVTVLRYNGADVTDGQTFTLALNNYRQSGGGGYDMIAGAPVVYDRGEDIRELLIEEVRSRGDIRAEEYFRENWRLHPAEAATAALAEQRDREVRAPAAAESGRARLRVLTTNDYHGRLESSTPSWADGRPVGGAATLAAYFQAEREGFGGPTIILDGGDVMQGTPVSNLTRGRSTIDYYNAVGYGGAAIGNHEFDWSPAVLRERMEQARFPWMAANILVAGSDTTPAWVQDTAYVDVDGVRVGLVGLITEETKSKTMAAYVAGLEFASGAATIDRWVPELRAGGADFVIVVAHEGGACDTAMTACEGNLIDWAREVRHRPDLMVGGHTHQVVRWHENGIAIIEAGSYGTRYGIVDLERVAPDSVDAWIRGTPMAWGDRVEPDTAIARIVAEAVEEVGPRIAERIGEAAELIPRGAGEHPLGRLIADAQRTASGAAIAIMNSGGVRAPLEAGPITWGDLYQIHPFGNMLMVLELRGSDIRDALEHAFRQGQPDAQVSGLLVEYDLTRPAGSRVVSARLTDGSPLRDDGVYRVVTNDFLSSGVGDGYEALGRGLSETPTGVADLDALIGYIQSLPQPIRAPRDVRMRDVSAGS